MNTIHREVQLPTLIQKLKLQHDHQIQQKLKPHRTDLLQIQNRLIRQVEIQILIGVQILTDRHLLVEDLDN